MPELGGITITLHSQSDATPIHEHNCTLTLDHAHNSTTSALHLPSSITTSPPKTPQSHMIPGTYRNFSRPLHNPLGLVSPSSTQAGRSPTSPSSPPSSHPHPHSKLGLRDRSSPWPVRVSSLPHPPPSPLLMTVEVCVFPSPGARFGVAFEVEGGRLRGGWDRDGEGEGNCGGDGVAGDSKRTGFLFFKLGVDGTEVVSWGVDVGEDAKRDEKGLVRGKVICGIFEAGKDVGLGLGDEDNEDVSVRRDEQTGLVRKGFYFNPPIPRSGEQAEHRHEGRLEIKVFRAAARKRIAAVLKPAGAVNGDAGIGYVDMGPVKKREAKRFYQYGLIDAVDEPYATFVYRICSNGQLTDLGVVETIEGRSEPDDSPSTGSASWRTLVDDAMSTGDATAGCELIDGISLAKVEVTGTSTGPAQRPPLASARASSPTLGSISRTSHTAKWPLVTEKDTDLPSEGVFDFERVSSGLSRHSLTWSPNKSERNEVVPSPGPALQNQKSTRRAIKGVIDNALRRRRAVTSPYQYRGPKTHTDKLVIENYAASKVNKDANTPFSSSLKAMLSQRYVRSSSAPVDGSAISNDGREGWI